MCPYYSPKKNKWSKPSLKTRVAQEFRVHISESFKDSNLSATLTTDQKCLHMFRQAGFFEIFMITLVFSAKQHLPKHMQHSVGSAAKTDPFFGVQSDFGPNFRFQTGQVGLQNPKTVMQCVQLQYVSNLRVWKII